MIPEAEVHSFLKERLGIPDVQQRLLEDRVSLLDDIIRRFMEVIPFQTITQVSLPNDAKRIPTLEENVQLVLSGQGGLCWTLNTAMLFILQALGYDVSPGLCTMTISAMPTDDHIILIVKNLREPGDYHLVDVGMGLPTFRAIPLDFETESPVYKESCETYKFVKKDGKILRMHKTYPEGISYPVVEGEWGLLCRFTLEPSSLDDIKTSIDNIVYSKVDAYFNQFILIEVFPKGRYVFVKRKKLVVEEDGGTLTTTELRDDQLVTTLKEKLPALPDKVLDSAVENYIKLEKSLEK